MTMIKRITLHVCFIFALMGCAAENNSFEHQLLASSFTSKVLSPEESNNIALSMQESIWFAEKALVEQMGPDMASKLGLDQVTTDYISTAYRNASARVNAEII